MSGPYYEFLGVTQGASTEEIRAAYRQRAAILHPDRNPGDAEVAQLFTEISKAYEVLVDPEKRAAYDASLKTTRPWWADLVDAAGEAMAVVEGVSAALAPPTTHKRAACPECRGSGEITFELGPLRVSRSCSSCEEEKPSPASRDRA